MTDDTNYEPALAQEPETIEAGGETFTLVRMDTFQTLSCLKHVFAIQRILSEVNARYEPLRIEVLKLRRQFDEGTLSPTDFEFAVMPIIRQLEAGEQDSLMELLSRAPGEVLKIAATAIRREEKFIGSLPPDEALDLMLGVLKVNKRFFEQKVLPKLAGLKTLFQPKTEVPTGETN